MLVVFLFGSLLISITVVVHSFGLIALSKFMVAMVGTFRLEYSNVGKTAAMIATVLGLFLIHGIEIAVWAIAYLGSGALTTLADAFYLSTLTFSTLGYGEVRLPLGWRLLTGMEGVNGFILIGWSTAYLVAASGQSGNATDLKSQ